jgi:hypothetical protein
MLIRTTPAGMRRFKLSTDRKTMTIQSLRFVELVLAVTVLAGCEQAHQGDRVAGATGKSSATGPATGASTPSVVSATIGQSSPAHVISGEQAGANTTGNAAGSEPELTVDSKPEEVCQAFLELLARGEDYAARRLLTEAAMIGTARAGLDLDAPGDENTSWSVLPARYATESAGVAQVDCLFRQAGNQDDAVPLTWMLRREPNGWKVFGMITRDANGHPDLLSFENSADLARIHNSIEGGETSRQAAGGDSGGAVR